MECLLVTTDQDVCVCVRMRVHVCKGRIIARFQRAIINLIDYNYISEFYTFLAFEKFPNLMEHRGSLKHLQ